MRSSADRLSLVDGIILVCLLGSLTLGALILRLLLAALLAVTGLVVFTARIVRRSGRTVGTRLLALLAIGSLLVWIAIAVRLAYRGVGGAP